MSDLFQNILLFSTSLIVTFLTMSILLKKKLTHKVQNFEENAKSIVQNSKKEAKEILEKAEEKTKEEEKDFKELIVQKEERLQKMESSLNLKDEKVKKRQEKIEGLQNNLKEVEQSKLKLNDELRGVETEIINKLAKSTNSNLDNLKKEVVEKYKFQLESENQEKLINIEEVLKDEAPKKAKKILVESMQRLSSPTSVERRAVNITVPKDIMKGKIAGKNGANVVFLEETLDVDIVFNDLPQTISVSAFNLVSRRIAQKTIELLIQEKGDIDQKIIQNSIDIARSEVDKELYSIGKNVLKKMNMEEKDPELTKIIGRLQYRTSYGQNIMLHSMEVGWAAAMMGAEIGLDEKVCKVAGFLHDLGKAIDQEKENEDNHDYLSKVLMEQYGYTEAEVHAAWTHHDAIPQETPEAIIVKAADAISAARPGARQESIERYIQRLKALEENASSFEGVKKTYAISAGREVRVFIDPERIKDKDMHPLAENIAHKIEENVTYPGKVMVNVIRRTEYYETAKNKN